MSDKHYRAMYIPSHTRAGPYVIGIITAYVYTRLKLNKFKFSKVCPTITTVVFTILLIFTK